MCISDIDAIHKKSSKTALFYLLISLFCVLFGAIYELFSHGVYSYCMIYAFVIPLAGGTLPFLAMSMAKKTHYPNAAARVLHHCAMASFTIGSIINGVLEIYGTTNALVPYYFLAGVILFVSGLTVYIVQIIKKRKLEKF